LTDRERVLMKSTDGTALAFSTVRGQRKNHRGSRWIAPWAILSYRNKQVHGAESRFQDPTDGPSSPFFERKLEFQTEGLPHTQRRDTSDRKEKKIGKKRLGKDKSFVATLRPLTFFHAGSHSPNGKLENPSGIWPPAIDPAYPPIQYRNPAHPGAAPLPSKSRTRHPPRRSSKKLPTAFRDDVWNCIELNWRHKGRRAQYTGMGWAAVLRVYLRHPLGALGFNRRARILRMSATHSKHPSSRQPLPHLFNTNRLRLCTVERLTSSCETPSRSGILEM